MTPPSQAAEADTSPWRAPFGWRAYRRIAITDPLETDRFAARLADATGPGDTILLSGGLGAGKTHLARAFIRHALGPRGAGAEVPSPSFTLVQTYDTPQGEIWHADLYRLNGPEETLELGLDLAMEEAICLVEWPERLAPDWPDAAVLLRMETVPDGPPDQRRVALWAPEASDLAARLVPAFDERAS